MGMMEWIWSGMEMVLLESLLISSAIAEKKDVTR